MIGEKWRHAKVNYHKGTLKMAFKKSYAVCAPLNKAAEIWLRYKNTLLWEERVDQAVLWGRVKISQVALFEKRGGVLWD